MRKRLLPGALILFCGVSPCWAANPFAAPSTLPLQAPMFDKIKDGDYAPAFDMAMAQQTADIAAIANSAAAPSFDNTIAAMEKAGRMLDRVNNTFGAVVQANTNPTLDKVQSDYAPKLAAQQDAIYLNPKLFARVKTLYDHRDALKLDAEQLQLLKIYYMQFVHAGANLSDADKAKLREINKRDASLEAAFEQKLIAATKAGALVLDNEAQLAGLSDMQIANAAHEAQLRGLKGKAVIPLQNTTQQPLLLSLTDRDVREKLFNARWTATEKGDKNDTRAAIAEIAQLRAQKAHLLGYPDFATYVLYDQMAQNPETVEKFLAQLVPATAKKIADESRAVQAAIDKSGSHFDLKPWDWERYAEQVRKEKYALDDDQLKPYFELNAVLQNGVFYAANKLYGVTFKERHDIPVYQPDVRVFDVFDKDGNLLGMMYFDYFKRDNKAGGAWMSSFVTQSKLLGTKPVIYNVANFTKRAPRDKPALISFDDVTTMFHEFGHALHGLFAVQTYPTLSGTNVARDFVEFPSQFNEHWALYPEVLKHYAVNYKTHQPIPQTLVDKIKASQTWGQGYELGELLAASDLDMQWHALKADAPRQDVDKFETQALAATHTDFFANVPTRYRSSYFLHIWANGYAAGYYAYQWTVMLDDDTYDWFLRHGGLTRENGQRFRDMILSRGHTLEYGPMFRAFYGKDPDIGPMLEDRGLAPEERIEVTAIFVDGDACPVKAEIEKVAARHGLAVTIVSNGGLRPSANPLLRHVTVAEGADVADDWIADHIGPTDIAITADIPLAARCLDKGARVLGPNGKPFTQDGIGMALGMRELSRHLRELTPGGQTHHAGFSKQDRSQFLGALENCIIALKRAG